MFKIQVGLRVLYQPPERGRRDQPTLDPIEAEVIAVKAENEADLLVQDSEGEPVTIYGARMSKAPEIARWRFKPEPEAKPAAAPAAKEEPAKEEPPSTPAPVAHPPVVGPTSHPFTTADLRPKQ